MDKTKPYGITFTLEIEPNDEKFLYTASEPYNITNEEINALETNNGATMCEVAGLTSMLWDILTSDNVEIVEQLVLAIMSGHEIVSQGLRYPKDKDSELQFLPKSELN